MFYQSRPNIISLGFIYLVPNEVKKKLFLLLFPAFTKPVYIVDHRFCSHLSLPYLGNPAEPSKSWVPGWLHRGTEGRMQEHVGRVRKPGAFWMVPGGVLALGSSPEGRGLGPL